MDLMTEREIEYMRVGHLTYFLLQTIESLPKVDMEPYYALILQEVEKKIGLGSGKSLVYPRLKHLYQRGYIESNPGASPNPRAKKPVQFYKLTKEGKKLLTHLKNENKRLRTLLE